MWLGIQEKINSQDKVSVILSIFSMQLKDFSLLKLGQVW